MFVILPTQHDRMSVRRLPWVSIAILALNVLVFLGIYSEVKANRTEVEAALEAVYDYWAGNPFIETTEAFEKVFQVPVSNLRSLMEGTLEPPEPRILASLQAEFEVLMSDALAAAEKSPFYRLGYVPAEPSLPALLTSLFVHAGVLHLLGNMFFLYLSAPYIEDLWGRFIFLIFYLAGGTVATLTHAFTFPDSSVPLVGASGAIAAAMGAFLVRLAASRIQFIYCYFFIGIRWGTFHAPAWIMLPLWLFWQWWQASLVGTGTGVAFWAHIGGFLFGMAVGAVMKILKIEERYVRPGIEKDVSYGGDRRLEEALEMREEGNHEEALKLFGAVLEEKPESLEARGGLFQAALSLGKEDLATREAVPLLERCIRQSRPDLALRYFEETGSLKEVVIPPRLLFALAGSQEKAGETESSLVTYRRIVGDHPRDILSLKALLRIAEISISSGNIAEAEEVLLRAHSHPLRTAEWQAGIEALESRAAEFRSHPDKQ